MRTGTRHLQNKVYRADYSQQRGGALSRPVLKFCKGLPAVTIFTIICVSAHASNPMFGTVLVCGGSCTLFILRICSGLFVAVLSTACVTRRSFCAGVWLVPGRWVAVALREVALSRHQAPGTHNTLCTACLPSLVVSRQSSLAGCNGPLCRHCLLADELSALYWPQDSPQSETPWKAGWKVPTSGQQTTC